MPKVHFVNGARKKNPVVRKGGSYYWWKPSPRHPKRYSKEYPKPSQLTESTFMKKALKIGEDLKDFEHGEIGNGHFNEAVKIAIGRILDLGEKQAAKLDKTPSAFRNSPTAQLLRSRVIACQTWARTLNKIDLSIDERLDKGMRLANECFIIDIVRKTAEYPGE